MKKVLLFIAMLGALILPSIAQALSIGLLSSSSNLRVGDTINVTVRANGVFDGLDPFEELLAFGFDVANSNASVLRLDSWNVGPNFADDSGVFPNTLVSGSAFPGLTLGDGDSFLLATLNFTALNAGSTTIGVLSDLQDPSEGMFYLFNGQIDLSGGVDLRVTDGGSSAPVPEPSTMILLGAGMGFVLLYRRRDKQV